MKLKLLHTSRYLFVVIILVLQSSCYCKSYNFHSENISTTRLTQLFNEKLKSLHKTENFLNKSVNNGNILIENSTLSLKSTAANQIKSTKNIIINESYIIIASICILFGLIGLIIYILTDRNDPIDLTDKRVKELRNYINEYKKSSLIDEKNIAKNNLKSLNTKK